MQNLSLLAAIEAVQQQSGGKALDVAFQDKADTPSYDATVFANGTMRNLTVNATTGAIIPGPEGTTPEAKPDREDTAELAASRNTKIDLTQAITAAERKGGGTAIDAGLEQQQGQVVYQIQLVKNGKLQLVSVNPVSGAVTAG